MMSMAAISLAPASHLNTIIMRLFFLRLLCLVSAAELVPAWDWNNESQPIAIYRSRPDLLAPILTPLEGIHNPDKMAPGYFFVSPYTNMQPGLYIYDNYANLIYTSFGSYGSGPSHAPRVCEYKGRPHLCFYTGVQHTGWGHGHGVIMDQNYRMVKSIEPSCTYQASSDMHEFYLTDGGRRALMTQYVRSASDLCSYGLCDGLGYIQSGHFQEVDVESGACIFSWSSIEHVPAEESLVMPSSTEISGTGESPESPWDYFHINSIDKSSFDSGYLVSARHVCAVYKIDGRSGGIMWQLGGKSNQYEYDDDLGRVEFGFQHDVRWISDSAEESVISMFDNASNGFTNTDAHTTGKIVHIDHIQKVARLVEWPLDPPWIDGHTHSAHSQGNLQLNLPGFRDADIGGEQDGRELGNRLMGFGNDPFFAEYAWTVNEETGQKQWEKVFYGALAYGYMMNYRAFKFDGWEGVPLTKPALWSFSKYGMNHTADNENTMVLYTSWNGHTKIDTYMFKGANTPDARRDLDSRDWEIIIAGWKKGGFETIYEHSKTFKYVYVEAFDKRSVSLGRSNVMETFTPNEFMREEYCDELACHFMDTNNPEREQMRETMQTSYEDWLKAKENVTAEEVEDIYESVRPHRKSSGRGLKILGFVISLTALGVMLLGLSWLAMRRYISVQKAAKRVFSILGLGLRRVDESRKGKYYGLDADDADIDGHDRFGSVMRNNDASIGDAKKENGLEAERQAFWRAQSL